MNLYVKTVNVSRIQIFVFLNLLFCLYSCRKYRDDESISFKSPMKRLTSHPWQVMWFGVDNKDSSQRIYFINTTAYKLIDETLTFTDQDISSGHTSTKYAASGNPIMFDFWALHGGELIGGKSTISIDMAYGQYGLRVPPKQEWNILKLTDSELHITTTFNSKNYAIFLKKP